MSHGESGAIASVSSLTAVAKHDTFILAEVIVVVVVATSDPLHCWLFFDRGVETSVERLTADRFFSMAKEFVVVVEVDVLVHWDVHEEHTVAFGRIIICDLVIGGAEPINLIRVYTIVAGGTKASMITCV